MLCGEAGEVIENQLDSHYDLVFFDAQKSLYHGQLLALLEKGLIGPGTLLLADNVNDRRAECEAFVAWFAEKGLLVCRLPDDFQN